MKRAAPIALASFVCGCYSTTLLQEPEPLTPGHVRVAVGVAAPVDGSSASGTSDARIAPEAAVRVGLPHDLEVRVKASIFGVETGVNARVHDGEAVDVMLMPGFQASFLTMEDNDSVWDEEFLVDHEILAVALPAIAKVELADVVDVFAGPDVRVGTRDREGWFALGGHLGAAFTVSRFFSIVPECALTYVAAGAAPDPPTQEEIENATSYGNSTLARGDIKAQCGLGISVGGKHVGVR